MNVLDLGCGTGLGANFYRPFAETLTGVDISPKMLEKAEEKKLYDRIHVFDMLQKWEFTEKFDLIYSSDVFVYFGNLEPIIPVAHLQPWQPGAFSHFPLKSWMTKTDNTVCFPPADMRIHWRISKSVWIGMACCF